MINAHRILADRLSQQSLCFCFCLGSRIIHSSALAFSFSGLIFISFVLYRHERGTGYERFIGINFKVADLNRQIRRLTINICELEKSILRKEICKLQGCTRMGCGG